MSIDWHYLLTALGLAFILEGMPYFLFAERMPAVLEQLSKKPASALRGLGFFAMLAGLGLVFFSRQSGAIP